MAKDTTPNFEPHLASRKDGHMIMWRVRMKTALGEYISLSDEYSSKITAAREMRKIRQEMAKAWMEAVKVASAERRATVTEGE